MECTGCGFDLQEGFAFCPQCGARQPKACHKCGYLCSCEFAFCPQCGTQLDAAKAAHKLVAIRASESVPLGRRPGLGGSPGDDLTTRPSAQQSPAEADRRTVTVLFADLTGFTALSESLDPEVMQTLQNEVFEELTAAVQNFGGFVDKFIGDALLALFGAPAVHEDDPERALRAALDMIDRMARMSARSGLSAGAPLALHIGINTGPVVTGGLGVGAAKSYSVTGDTVNVAQRLQGMAAPGAILVGPLTQRLTRHAFRFESLGDVTLRGKSGSVLAHRLVEPLASPRTARGLETQGLKAPLIGRDAELARLLGCLDLTCAGEAQLVRIFGEAGIGKSRLVREFVARVAGQPRFRNVAIRRNACSPLGEQPYGAIGAVVRSAAGMMPNETAADMRAKLGTLLSELGLGPEDARSLMPLLYHVLGIEDPDDALRHVEPERLRRQILYAVRTIVERRLELSPLLIIIEDLHWADKVSLEALRFVMDRLERASLMLLVTQRPGQSPDLPASSRVSQTTLRLTPLSADNGRQLLEALFGDAWTEASARTLRDQILDRADGNPLFIEEILRGFIDTGVLKPDGGRWRVAGEAAADIPATIEAMLLSRFERLPQNVRRLAQEAAAIGPRFEAGLLGAVAVDPTGLEAGLETLCEAEIVEEVADGASSSSSYRFKQTLLQHVIYQNLLMQRRVEMHERIGAALERLCGANPERLEDLRMLGHHFCRCAMPAKAARYLTTAADRARAVYANDDACRLYEQAVAALAAGGDAGHSQQGLELREQIADLGATAGRRDVAREQYIAILEAHRERGDSVAVARILRKLGGLLWHAGKRQKAEGYYAEAAIALDGRNAPVERALLLQERGRLAFRAGDFAVAAERAEEALRSIEVVAEGADAVPEGARATAEALNTKGVALARLGRNMEAIAEVERSVATAEAAGLLGAACRGYTNLAVLYTLVDPARAIDVCRRGLEVAARIGDLGFQARLFANLAVASCTFTDRCADEGVPAAEKAIEIDRALDQREHLAVPLIVLGQIHQCKLEPGLAERCYREALAVAEETGDPQQLFPCYDGLATLGLDRDDYAEAERYFSKAQELCSKHGLDTSTLVVLPFLD
ncbi:adenylate/guanylate cyclase domain-containing protein [Arvimicrobium flavum]|uniref:adenylate/guanylate cyclase domain-containing protein n=1 Tax=Arvimicrobium flavum TaxID=3393320 RepID=UPI00237A0E15|nr:adenylate/guanylate cyclase domain-containing protein [Mesorhizobium shangrilense]